MAKLRREKLPDGTDAGLLSFQCPGCGARHAFRIMFDPDLPEEQVWSWNGDMDGPTFDPALKAPGCHLRCVEGKLHFFVDSGHKLAGRLVDLPDEL